MHEQALNGGVFDEADVAESELVTRRGVFRAVAFRHSGHEHMALVHGDFRSRDDVLVRVHSECMTGDIFRAMRCECGDQLDAALDRIVTAGGGILVYLRGHEGRGIGLVSKVRTHVLQDQGLDTLDSATTLGLPVDVRDYTPAAHVLRHLRVRSVRLMSNNPDKLAALEAHGAELRRIERDLHDGTQNRLVAVAMHLGIVERALRRDPASALPLVLRAQDAATDALAGLREVVRAIYPPVLAERGLDGAVAGLVAACPVPCTLTASALR
ncbi:GTP cyclohydrolase II RibA, partial [Saccharothrix sp. MB29]|nr:GTP cyclohydrolase II RibA [Saccharothrix sp. MB29]